MSRASEGRPVAKALRGHRKAKSDQSAPKATVGLKACPEMQGSKARKASAVQGVWLESEASAERKAPIALPAETAPLARWDSEASAAQGARRGDGAVGPRGEKGEKGDAGIAGPIGPRSEVGPAGAKSERGEPGLPGIQGKEGPVGPSGGASSRARVTAIGRLLKAFPKAGLEP